MDWRAPERVDGVDPGTALEEPLHHGHVAHVGGHHERRHPHHASMLEPVAIDVGDHLGDLTLQVRRHRAFPRKSCGHVLGTRRFVARLERQARAQSSEAVKRGKLEKMLLCLAVNASRGERSRVGQAKPVPGKDGPGHGRDAKDRLPYRVCLLLLSLELELPGFLLPLVERRRFRAYLGEVLPAHDAQ